MSGSATADARRPDLPVSGGELRLLQVLWPAPGYQLAAGTAVPDGWERAAVFAVPRFLRSRTLVPLSPSAAGAAALRRVHHGTPVRARAARGAAAVALRLGGARPFLPDRVQVLHRSGGPAAGIDAHLAQVLELPRAVVAPSFGPPRANLKPVLQVLDGRGRTVAYAKVGFNAVTRALVAHEAAFLAGAPQLPLACVRVPRLLHHGTWRGLDLIAVAALASGSRPGRARRDVLLVEAAAEVARLHGTEVGPLRASAYWRGVRAAMDRLRGQGEGGLLDRVAEAVEADHAPTPLTFGTWHGDWGPWNMTWQRGALAVWDWERTAHPVPVGFDPLHFLFQRARLGRGATPLDAASQALRLGAPALSHLGVPDRLHRLVFVLYAVELLLRELDDQRLLQAEGQDSSRRPPVEEVVRRYLLREAPR